MNSQVDEALLEDRLRAVYDLTEAGDYEGALADLERARSSCPSSIYILALERQLKTLMEFLDAQELGEARRMELIEPMPGLIECAVRDLKKPNHIFEPDLSQSGAGQSEPEPAPVAETEDPRPSEQIVDARSGKAKNDIEAVKLLHFQQATVLMAKGQYEQALIEVRRVFEVDPDNAIAQEYAARVERMLAQPRRSTLFYVQPPEESPAAPASTQVRTDETPQVIRSAVAETGRDPRSVAPPKSERFPANEDRTDSKRMQSSGRYNPMPAQRVQDQSRDDGPVSQSYRPPAIDHPRRGTHEPHRFSTRMIVVTIIMGVVVLAGAAYAAFLLNRDSSASAASRVINTGLPEDRAISAASAATSPVESSQTPVQKVSGEAPAESSPVPEKSAIEPVKVPAPPPSAQRETSDPATLHPVKPEPVRNPVQKPVQGAETNEKPKNAQRSQSPPVIPASQLLATSMPESRPAASGVPVTETTPASAPEYVPTQKEPQIVKLERPEIPDYIWMSGVVEKVVIKVLIDVDGKPVDTQILMSSKSALEKPVIKAVMNSTFLPGQSAIGPVKTWLTIPFRIKTSK